MLYIHYLVYIYIYIYIHIYIYIYIYILVHKKLTWKVICDTDKGKKDLFVTDSFLAIFYR